MPDQVLSHYVARCLTKSWEFGDRRLRYADLLERKIKVCSSRSLFAEHGAFSPAVEAFLNKYVETPISQLMTDILESATLKITHWPIYRAVYLLFATQFGRAARIRDPGSDELETMAQWDETKLDQLTQLMQQEKNILRIPIHEEDIPPVHFLSDLSFPIFPVLKLSFSVVLNLISRSSFLNSVGNLS